MHKKVVYESVMGHNTSIKMQKKKKFFFKNLQKFTLCFNVMESGNRKEEYKSIVK